METARIVWSADANPSQLANGWPFPPIGCILPESIYVHIVSDIDAIDDDRLPCYRW